eukprot:TRINITY_DN1471_c1_g1_i1.p1 TRINITY_DN1471_c1_g1~~TRINITY_DN1471_c1_g1_i1.p1  ORF type:complete len:420 (+),score=68.15 TRINITY_DN1471_c1_g1_i1:60-1319(+)
MGVKFWLLAALVGSAASEGEYSRLVNWVQKEGGFMHDDIQIATDEAKGRLIKTTNTISEGTTLLTVPWDLIITGNEQFDDPNLSSLVPVPELQLFLKLLFAESDNPFSTYINTIPTSFSTGLYYQPSDVACLSVDGKNHHEYQRQQFSEFSKIARTVHQEEKYTFPVPRDNTLRWTYSAVFTRAVRLEDGRAAMIPIFDMINHSYKPNVLFDYDNKGIVLTAGTQLEQGTELLLNYGTHLTPNKLLVLYGFVDESLEKISGGVQIPQDDNKATKPLLDIGCGNTEDLYINITTGTASDKLLECVTLSILPSEKRQQYPNLPVEDQEEILAASRTDVYQVYGAHLVKVMSQVPHPEDDECTANTPLIPLIRNSNKFIRSAYLTCKDNLDLMIKESGTNRVVEIQHENKYENEDLDDDEEL